MSGVYPPRGPFGGGPAPTGLESATFDRFAIDDVGVPQSVLMENAGRGAAHVVQRLFPSGPVRVLVGAGNNGGDGLVVARTLSAWGRDVHVVLVAKRAADDPLLHGWALECTSDGDLDDAGWNQLLDPTGVVVDAVLGTGVRGAPRGRQATVIERLNGSGCRVLAVDVPSGIDADTGAVPGAAVRADVTVAFGAPKLGSLLHPARALSGRIVALEIGFPPWPADKATGELVTPAWVDARRPARSSDTHKNAVGRVTVVGGRSGMAGAVILTARAAFRAGAGYVRVCSDAANREALQSAVPEAVFVDAADGEASEEAARGADAIVIGPGLGTDEVAAALLGRMLAASEAALLLDADALSLVAAEAVDAAPLRSEGRVLMTPHPGEMARLLGSSADSVLDDRVAALRAAVERHGCACILKGAPSLVAAPGSRILVDTQGSSDLAVAGMGDALAGVCGALLAAGATALEAGALGLYFSGRASRIAGRGVSLMPSDVIRWLPDALRERAAPTSDLGLSGVVFDAEAAR